MKFGVRDCYDYWHTKIYKDGTIWRVVTATEQIKDL